MPLTPVQIAAVQSVQSDFASLKAKLGAMQSQAKASGDAKGVSACYAALTAVMQAHVVAGKELIEYDLAAANQIIPNGPGR